MNLLRWLDIALLALALPVFITLDAPLLGYAAAGGAWLLGRGIHILAQRRSARLAAEGNRRGALGVMGFASLGRAWLVAVAVLVAGLIEREAGLAGALVGAAVVTTYFVGLALARMHDPKVGEL